MVLHTHTHAHTHTHTSQSERTREQEGEREHICSLMKSYPGDRKFDDLGEKGESYWSNLLEYAKGNEI